MSDFTPTQAIITTDPGALAMVSALPLDQHPAAVYLANLGSLRSRATQRQALEVIAKMLTGAPDIFATNWAALRFQHTQAIRARLAEQYAPASANRMLCALRGVLKAAWRLGAMSADDMMRACDVKSVKGKRLPAGRALGTGEIKALVNTCEEDMTPAGARDAAMIACMYPGGLRRDEVISLALADYDPLTGALTVRHGKGNKERIAGLNEGSRRAMADWLAIRGNEPGALFWPINKGGKLQPRRMTNQAVYNALAKRSEQAKVSDVSPHDLRRSFATDYIAETGDLHGAKVLLGHESITTTDRYNRAELQRALNGIEKLHFPYRGRMI